MVCQPEKEECLTITIHTADPRFYSHVSCSYWEERCKILGAHRVHKKCTESCHHLLLLLLKFTNNNNLYFASGLVLKNIIMIHEATDINSLLPKNGFIITGVSNSNYICSDW
jgi:hypothetical protein